MGEFGVRGHLLMLGLAVLVAIAVALAAVLVADRALGRSVAPGHNSTLSPFLTVVGLVFGALLSFTVVVSWQQFSSAEENVSHEASTLTTMYRQTVGMPEPERTKLREQLRKYAESVEGQDWEALDSSGRNDGARAAITGMYRLLGNQPNVSANPINGEFLSQLTVLANDRNQRVLDAQPRIPPLLWSGLLFGGIVLVAITGFMRLDNRFGHAVLSSAVAILLGLLLFIIYWLAIPSGRKWA